MSKILRIDRDTEIPLIFYPPTYSAGSSPRERQKHFTYISSTILPPTITPTPPLLLALKKPMVSLNLPILSFASQNIGLLEYSLNMFC